MHLKREAMGAHEAAMEQSSISIEILKYDSRPKYVHTHVGTEPKGGAWKMPEAH